MVLILISIPVFSQTQIGNNIIPTIHTEGTGNNVSISADGNRMVFGSRLASINGNDFAGAARVYEKSNGTWEQLGQILEGENELQFFGETIAISQDGNRIAIGTRDYLRIYTYNGSTWQPLGQDLTIPNMSRTLKMEFSSNGQIIAVPFQQTGSTEVVKVFSFNGNVWQPMGVLPEPSGFDTSLSDSGARIAMVFEDENDDIKVFDFINGAWNQVGQTISPTTNFYPDNFLFSGDGSRLFIFSADQGGSVDQGFLSTYELINGTWTQTIEQIDFFDINPYRISLATSTNGNQIAIGTSDDNFFEDYNSAQVFEIINNTWQQAGTEIQIWQHDEQTPSVVSMTPDGATVAMSSLLSAPGMEEGLIRTFDYTSVLSTTDVININELNIYPNPTKGDITIAFKKPETHISLTITNILGQLISTEMWKNKAMISTEIQGNAGVYLATLETGEGISTTLKVIKE
ncbi:hypothetical protein ULMS_08080 [Patiriisocius marinistellae]|uniref:Secretion system C-terminal sorting domain-containing protein n=2 Tax=Patiriisocius marinistellae TaxID=2494560 RepID=A0A5J4FU18_9FLAO|nr:hypothetical protein ULMS_08080 [Patiriisocius marinistellae]